MESSKFRIGTHSKSHEKISCSNSSRKFAVENFNFSSALLPHIEDQSRPGSFLKGILLPGLHMLRFAMKSSGKLPEGEFSNAAGARRV
jgi:hypothetical protein